MTGRVFTSLGRLQCLALRVFEATRGGQIVRRREFQIQTASAWAAALPFSAAMNIGAAGQGCFHEGGQHQGDRRESHSGCGREWNRFASQSLSSHIFWCLAQILTHFAAKPLANSAPTSSDTSRFGTVTSFLS